MRSRFLRIGGITMEVVVYDPHLDINSLPAWSMFETGPHAADLMIEARLMDRYRPPEGELLFDSGEVWRLYRERDGSRLEFRSTLYGDVPYKLARISPDLSRVDVEVRPVVDWGHDPLEFPLDELLVNALVTRRNGVELHACGVVDLDGTGILFCGNSGDGKTTTARLWLQENASALSDDRIIVRQEQGMWWMYGTPWHGEADISSPARAPLSQIFLLSKAAANQVAPVTAGAAVARLLACAFPPFHDRSGLESVLGTLEELSRDVPVAKLEFTKDSNAVAFARAASRPRK